MSADSTIKGKELYSGPMPTDHRSIVCEICGEPKAAEQMLLLVEGAPRVCRECFEQVRREKPQYFERIEIPEHLVQPASLDRRGATDE